MSLHIGLDFDGVVVNSHVLRSVVVKELYGFEIAPLLLQESRFMEAGLTRQQYDAIKRGVYTGSHEPEEVPGAIEAIGYLQKCGHFPRIVTARSGDFLTRGQIWLAKRKTTVPVLGVGYKASKVEACQGLHIYVDDDLEKLTPLIGIVPHLFFFNWPWNEHEIVPHEIERVWSWPELMDCIHRIHALR